MRYIAIDLEMRAEDACVEGCLREMTVKKSDKNVREKQATHEGVIASLHEKL
jgi:hypothetical protein